MARSEREQERLDGSAAAAARPARGRRAVERQRSERTGIAEFVRECWAELNRVQWPDRRELTQATAVVLIVCLVLGVYIGVLDALLSRASHWLINQY